MKQSQKILLHGSRAPMWMIFGALIIEYIVFFYAYGWSLDNLLLVTGYGVLCMVITCNNHGRTVRIHYEQELSLMMKNILTNLVFCMFGIAVLVDTKWNILNFLERLIALTMVQVGSILVICKIYGIRSWKNYDRKRVYFYQDEEPDISLIPLAQAFCMTAHDLSEVRSFIMKADEVYLYDMQAQMRNDLLKICFEYNKPVYFTTKLTDMELRGATLAQDGETPIFHKSAYGVGRKSALVKRLFDVVLSGVALVLLSPVFLLVAIAIKIEDQGDVFYRQVRCTKDMRQFQIIKFRSMVMHAEAVNGPKIADKKDSRMTKVGHFIRKCKIDELPQLINIFKGDMSFVGPRPERPEIIEEIVKTVPEYTYRTTVPAGLTGYAQVHGDYHTDFLDKLKWDLMYIENYSLMLDFKIILMTVPVLLRGSDDV